MKKVLLGLALLVSIQTANASSLKEQVEKFCTEVSSVQAPRDIDMDQAVSILKDEGFTVKKVNDRKAKIKINGRTLLLLRFPDGDYQIYYGATGVKVGAKDIVTWNRKKRLSRAYLDKDGDPALEFDLQSDSGLTPAQLVTFVKTFSNTSVPSFVEFLLERDKS